MNIRYQNVQCVIRSICFSDAPHCAPFIFRIDAPLPPNMCGDEDRPKWGRNSLSFSNAEARAVVCLASWAGAKAAAVPRMAARQAAVFILARSSIQQNWGGRRKRQGSGRKSRATCIRHRDLCFNLGKIEAKACVLPSKASE